MLLLSFSVVRSISQMASRCEEVTDVLTWSVALTEVEVVECGLYYGFITAAWSGLFHRWWLTARH